MDPASDWVVSGGKGALDFDGVNDFVSLPNASYINGKYTFSAWFNLSAAGNSNYIFSHSATSEYELRFFGSSRRLQQQHGFPTAGFVTVTAPVANAATLGQWFHGASTFDGSTVRLYQNGLLVASGNSTLQPAISSLRIGNRPGVGLYFPGQLDDLIVFNDALTANEIAQVYRLGRGYGVFPEPDFDEGFAAAAGFKAYWARRQSQLIGGGL
jgi:hypothetical protein